MTVATDTSELCHPIAEVIWKMLVLAAIVVSPFMYSLSTIILCIQGLLWVVVNNVFITPCRDASCISCISKSPKRKKEIKKLAI